MRDPETLSDDAVDVPAPFEGEQAVTFDDYDIKEKAGGNFWLLLNFNGPNGERASWNGNFFKAPDTDGRKNAHRISWRGLREFFTAVGFGDGDIPKASPKAIATALSKMVSVNGDGQRVLATIGIDARGYTTASRFKAA